MSAPVAMFSGDTADGANVVVEREEAWRVEITVNTWTNSTPFVPVARSLVLTMDEARTVLCGLASVVE